MDPNSGAVTKIDDFLNKKLRKNVYKRLKGKKINIVALEAVKSFMTDPRQIWNLVMVGLFGFIHFLRPKPVGWGWSPVEVFFVNITVFMTNS